MFKWGIIGSGVIASTRFAPASKKIKKSKIVGVYDSNYKNAEKFAEKFQVKSLHRELDGLLDDDDIDGVYIASPNQYHEKQTILSAKRGKHILCEKPMALSVKEAENMVRTARKNNVCLAIGNVMAFHSSHKLMKTLLDDHIIGRISLIKSDYLISLPFFQGELFTENQFRLIREHGGGVIPDLAPHCINTIRYLINSEVESVVSMMDTLRFTCDAEDTSAILAKYKSGPIGVISLSFATDWGRNGIEFYGDRGALISEQSLSQISESTVKSYINGNWETYRVEPTDPYIEQITHFIDCIENNDVPINSGEMGLSDMRVIDGVYKAHTTNQTVKIEEK